VPRSLPLTKLLAPVLFSILLIAILVPSASAKGGVSVKITSPRTNSTVAGSVSVKAKIRPLGKSHTIKYYVDGKLQASEHRGKSARSSRSKKLNLSKFSKGTHTIRIVVKSRKGRATSAVRVKVDDTSSTGSTGKKKGIGSTGPTAPGNSEPVPTGNRQDFQLIFADDFTKDAALGSFGSDYDANKIVYTGATGTKWRAYPKSYTDTYHHRPYRSDQVLSVHDGQLDFHLHNVDGQPAGANPSPVINGTSQYQTYGRYSTRIKVDNTDLDDYYMAWLLWPENESAWASAESDYPEGELDAGKNGVQGFHHYGAGQQSWFGDNTVDIHDWHTYTQEWTPSVRRYYVDDRLIHTTINPVYAGPERWQLQTETFGSGTDNGHLMVDWVAVYSWAPGTSAD
jgi:hypothetical protein